MRLSITLFCFLFSVNVFSNHISLRPDRPPSIVKKGEILSHNIPKLFVLPTSVVHDIERSPKKIKTYYQQYEEQLKESLGPAFSALNKEGLHLIFASIIAHKAKPPKGMSGSLITLKTLAKEKFLNCKTYVELTYLLFNEFASKHPIKFGFVAWVNPYIHGHVQLFATGTGIPLFLDPTVGLVTKATFDQIASGFPIALHDMRSAFKPEQWNSDVLNQFNKTVIMTINQGLIKPSDFLYYYAQYKPFATAPPRYSKDVYIPTPQYETVKGGFL